MFVVIVAVLFVFIVGLVAFTDVLDEGVRGAWPRFARLARGWWSSALR